MAKKPSGIPVSPLTDEMYRNAMHTAKRAEPFDVTAVSYDRAADSIDLTLRTGLVLRLPRHDIRELVGAKPNGLEKVEIQPGGDGISFRSIDVDISVPGLLADLLGPLFARALGRRARGRSSEKKAKSSRVNGKKGGRPTKTRVS
jgi:Protein of unknown function (DUF2442)